MGVELIRVRASHQGTRARGAFPSEPYIAATAGVADILSGVDRVLRGSRHRRLRMGIVDEGAGSEYDLRWHHVRMAASMQNARRKKKCKM